MSDNRLAATTASTLFQIFDQSKSVRRAFKDEDDTIPPDGVLDRGEFPSAKFDAIDRLQLSDGRITPAELAQALGKLAPAQQQAILDDANATKGRMTHVGHRFMGSFAAFGLGGVALAAGLVFGGPVGLGAAALGGLGLLGGFGSAVWNIFAAGREGKGLFDRLDARL
ncbi:MAG: hypothetical protein JWM80_1505 [Cyanobacteria bacterium RYN_339]|nr:hypothetical protein [Cyanobacteria bacterium RYN_339]